MPIRRSKPENSVVGARYRHALTTMYGPRETTYGVAAFCAVATVTLIAVQQIAGPLSQARCSSFLVSNTGVHVNTIERRHVHPDLGCYRVLSFSVSTAGNAFTRDRKNNM